MTPYVIMSMYMP